MVDWNDERVLITGGLGFAGSNLARRMLDEGADVVLLDTVREEKLLTVEDIREDVDIADVDVREKEPIQNYVSEADIVYHLAAKSSRPAANEEPRKNLQINCGGPLNVLESAADRENPPRVVYVSSLATLGNVPETIDESTEPKPVDMYGIHKRTVEDYCQLYTRLKDVPTTVVRPANLYGPRAPLYDTGYGIINQFVGDALRDESLSVFEPSDLRDFLFIEDMVDALTHIGQDDRAIGEKYVLGTGESRTMKQAAELVIDTAKGGSLELVPWTETWQGIRRGDVVIDPSKIEEQLGWSTSVNLEEGLEKTVDFYQSNREKYLD
ncbi:NAD(P)-dependent oxidoreductase [Haloarcula sp. JP-L23]|uniref:NAD-dependent epimerase/dehydratase family protein n=1 Tax=Haloarcula sp. JP-L23 TaxID=2716717 RepID=UPI00140ED87B|nr:SDR family NAD(P)-dependent oxidoreductase [Haloarcula sp. JP-L23]